MCRGNASYLEDFYRLVQELMPQVKHLPEGALVAHIRHVYSETRKRVYITWPAVFTKVQMQGFRVPTVDHDLKELKTALANLKKRWTADLKDRATHSAALRAAFEDTVVTAQPTGGTRNAPRRARPTSSMQEPDAPVAPTDHAHMSNVIHLGRHAHCDRMKMSSSRRKKLNLTQHTDYGAALLENCTHATYGEVYTGECQEDKTGEWKDLHITIGRDCFEHDTLPEWQALGHPAVMRCHCVGVDACDAEEDGDGEPRGAFDYSIFHDDFSVESFDFDQLVRLNLVRLPDIAVTKEYEVVWTKAPPGPGPTKTVTQEARHTSTVTSRPALLRTAAFWQG